MNQRNLAKLPSVGVAITILCQCLRNKTLSPLHASDFVELVIKAPRNRRRCAVLSLVFKAAILSQPCAPNSLMALKIAVLCIRLLYQAQASSLVCKATMLPNPRTLNSSTALKIAVLSLATLMDASGCRWIRWHTGDKKGRTAKHDNPIQILPNIETLPLSILTFTMLIVLKSY